MTEKWLNTPYFHRPFAPGVTHGGGNTETEMWVVPHFGRGVWILYHSISMGDPPLLLFPAVNLYEV